MQAPNFTTDRLKRIIAVSGLSYTFQRFGKDSYHQPTTTVIYSKALKGVYHESSAYSPLATSDAGRVGNSPQPMLLTEFGDSKGLQKGDTVVIATKTYRVTDVRDVGDFGIIGEVSLEVVI